MQKIIVRYIILLLFSFSLIGCGAFQPYQGGVVEPLQLGDTAMVDQTKADNAKKIVLSMEEVIEVKGVNYKEDIYIAPEVNHFNRLRLEGIRKDGFDRIKKRYPDAAIHLSTDKKIFMELEKLENELKENKISEQALEKKLKKLEEDMKG